jgi:hypothetical protein
MKKIIMAIVLCFVVSDASAKAVWTDNNWRGAGVGVENVYLQWNQHWVQFYGSDGKSYFYYWGVEEVPNEKAKMFFSMLLTAFSADKKVSIAFDDVPNAGGHHSFTFLNLHN